MNAPRRRSDADRTGSPLDGDRIAELLAENDVPWRDVTYVAVTGSTNADLVERVATGDADEGAVVVAAEQTSGRGRLDRTWASPPGSLSFSVVLAPPAVALGFVPALMGTAVAAAVRRLTGVAVTLKWPNDLMIGDGKLGGILVERVADRAVAGCGINVSLSADQLPVPGATSLSIHGEAPDREELLVACLAELAKRNDRWRSAGYSTERSGLLDEYRALCDTIGRTVSVRLPGGSSLEGTAAAIDGGGRLVVECGDGRRVVAAGDVEHVRATD